MANLYGKYFPNASSFGLNAGAKNFATALCRISDVLCKVWLRRLRFSNKKEPNFFSKFPALAVFTADFISVKIM